MEISKLQGAVTIIALIALILGITLIILDEFVEQSIKNAGVPTAVANETWATASNSTNATLTYPFIKSVTNVTNTTNGAPLASTNYTIYLDQGKIILTTGDADLYFEGYNINVSYTYYAQTAESSIAVNETLKGIGDFGDWMPLIVIVIAASIILGLVLNTFLKRRVR